MNYHRNNKQTSFPSWSLRFCMQALGHWSATLSLEVQIAYRTIRSLLDGILVVVRAAQERCCLYNKKQVLPRLDRQYTSSAGVWLRLRNRRVFFHSSQHSRDDSSGNIQNSITVIELRVFAILLKYCSQMSLAFVRVCQRVYKLAA